MEPHDGTDTFTGTLHIAALKIAPIAVAAALVLCAWVLAGTTAGLVALATACASLVSAKLAARKLDAAANYRRRLRTHRFMQDSINAIPMPIFVKNAKGRLIMVNDAYCEQRGLAREDIQGHTASELASTAELAAIIIEEDKQVLQGSKVRKEECVPNPLTGAPMQQIVTKALSWTEADKPVIIGTFYDITELRSSEARTREALVAQTHLRSFLQLIFDALPNPLFVKDEQHRYIMTNRAHVLTTGLAEREIIGKRVSDLAGPEIAVRLEAHEDEMLANPEGVVWESEVALPTPQGPARQEIVRKVVGRDADGKRVIIATTTDITSLRHAEARWQFALEGAGDGLWDWDIPAGKVFYSPRWKAMQGFSEEEIGSSEAERTRRVHPDDAEAAQAALDIHLSGRVPIYICEFRQQKSNGDYVWVMDRGRVVERAPDGRPLRMIGIYTDITEHRLAAEELRRHRDSLRDMVEEQTAGLILAKETAERANAAKSQFLANMSHELRTPMHAVLSFARLGEERALKAITAQETPEKLLTYFQRIGESGDRLMALLNDLLDLSKLEAGRMVLHLQRSNLRLIIDDALREFEASLLARRIRITVESTEADMSFMADTARMAQVVRNLLSNAIKFSDEGGRVVLQLNALPASSAPASVELVVTDEGVGIPASELESVFDIFVQSSATRSNAGGTGLGLPICREIVDAHHGRIFARNRSGPGAEFVVQIPRHPPADTQLDAPSH